LLFAFSSVPAAFADLTNEERESIANLRSVYAELTQNNFYDHAAEARINQFKKNLPKNVAASPNVQIAIVVVQIDRGVNPQRDAIGIATRLKTNCTAWKVALVAELVFGDANGAVSILSRSQKAVVAFANSAEIDDATRKEAIEHLSWIRETANQLAILPATLKGTVDQIIDSSEANDLINANQRPEDLNEADPDRLNKDVEFQKKLQEPIADKTAFIKQELSALEAEMPAQIRMLVTDFKARFTELEPLAASLSAAGAVSSDADSAVISLNKTLTTAVRKAKTNDPQKKVAAEVTVQLLEMQLASARAKADTARAEEVEAEFLYQLKLGKMQDIYVSAASAVNSGKSRVKLLRKEFDDVIGNAVELQEAVSKTEKMMSLLLKEFPPIPTLVRKKLAEEMALEETRRIVHKLQLSVDNVFEQILQ
jgi:hypothetical protein